MKKQSILLLLLLTLVCGIRLQGVSAEREKKITVMLYLCGSNLESETGAASRDLKEILRSRFDRESVNVIAMAGGSRKWWSGLNEEETAIYDLSGSRPANVYSDGLKNMGDPETLETFLDFGYENYPAERYALIIWNHGAGPMGGVCLDYLANGDSLDMSELGTALAESFPAKEKLDWIGFDACLMATVETALQVQPYADYMIASQETEPSEGWNYHFLQNIHEDRDGGETGIRIVDDYFSSTTGENRTLSCLDLSVIGQVQEEMNTFFMDIARTINYDNFQSYSMVCQEVTNYGRVGSDDQSYDLIDLYDLVEHYSEQNQEQAERLLKLFDRAVRYNRSVNEGSNGISIYHPYYNKGRYAEAWKELYPSISICPGYTRYIRRFSSILLGEENTDFYDLFEAEISVDATDAQENVVDLQLTDEQAEQFVTGQIVVMEANDEGYYEIFSSDEVNLTDEGNVTASFVVQKLYAVDADGNILAGPISYDIQNGSYQISACCLDMSEMLLLRVLMQCSPDEENPKQLKIDSIFVYDSLLENFTNRLNLDWMTYDCIFFPQYYRDISYDDVVRAYEDWQMTGYSMKENIFAGTDWHFELAEETDTPEDLYVTVQVTDAQVNTFSSEPVAID